jgi:hypothetical protein
VTDYVIRDGQRIAVKTLSTSATPRRRRTSDPFVTVPLAWAARAAKATNTKKALVWLELLYATWQSRNNSVVLSNGRLARAGVSRNAKYRALRELEAAGLVQMERRGRGASRVTIIS